MLWTSTGSPLTGGAEAAAAYNRGVGDLLRPASAARSRRGRLGRPRPDLRARPRGARAARPRAVRAGRRRAPGCATPRCTPRRSTERERSHVHAVAAHVARRLRARWSRHLAAAPHATRCCSRRRCRRSPSPASPRCPQEAWAIVERCDPGVRRRLVVHRAARVRAPGAGPLRRGDGAVLPLARTSSRAPATRRTPGRTRTTRPATTRPGWPGWTAGSPATGAAVDSLSHFSWHAALHELSLGDLDAVRRRYEAQLRPEHGLRLPGAGRHRLAAVALGAHPGRRATCPGIDEVLAVVDGTLLEQPADPVPRHARGGHAAAPPTTRPGSPRWRVWAERARAPDPARGRRPAGPGPAPAGARPVAARRRPTRWPRCSRRAVAARRHRRPARGRRGDPDRARCCAPAGTTRRRRCSTARLDRRPCRATDAGARSVADPRLSLARLIWPPLTVTFTSRERGRRRTGAPTDPSSIENWLPWQGQLMVPPSTSADRAALVGADRA